MKTILIENNLSRVVPFVAEIDLYGLQYAFEISSLLVRK